jgi:hypothetical protein
MKSPPPPMLGYGGGGQFFYISTLESKKPSYMFMWVMYNIDHRVYKLVQAYRSQESSSWLLLTSSYLLDSLIPEGYCMNKLIWFE